MPTAWKTALHSVSYARLWGQAFLPLDDFLARARDLGFDAIMLMAKRPHLSVLDGEALPAAPAPGATAPRSRLPGRLHRLRLRRRPA
jgi:hypothetical protein